MDKHLTWTGNVFIQLSCQTFVKLDQTSSMFILQRTAFKGGPLEALGWCVLEVTLVTEFEAERLFFQQPRRWSVAAGRVRARNFHACENSGSKHGSQQTRSMCLEHSGSRGGYPKDSRVEKKKNHQRTSCAEDSSFHL